MHPEKRRAAVLSVVIPVVLMVTGNSAQASGQYGNVDIQLASNAISLDQAVENIRKQTGGRILSAKKDRDNPHLYVIKVLMPDGQVRTFRVDARTGANR